MAETYNLIVPADDPELLREVTEKLQAHIASLSVPEDATVPTGGVFDRLENRIQRTQTEGLELFGFQEVVWIFQIVANTTLTLGFLLNVFDHIKQAREDAKKSKTGVLVEKDNQEPVPLEQATEDMIAPR